MKTKVLTHFIPGDVILTYLPELHSKQENLKYIQKYIRVIKTHGGLGAYNAHHKTAAQIVKSIGAFQDTILRVIGLSSEGYTLMVHSDGKRLMICKGYTGRVIQYDLKEIPNA